MTYLGKITGLLEISASIKRVISKDTIHSLYDLEEAGREGSVDITCHGYSFASLEEVHAYLSQVSHAEPNELLVSIHGPGEYTLDRVVKRGNGYEKQVFRKSCTYCGTVMPGEYTVLTDYDIWWLPPENPLDNG